ncbi:hypothetical protein EVAR_60662_1 [Eumeta japonica]|uniref:Uncharacterized protein n=1 Tax=Eumeta variegata TaxID=151549 RepID=A0A4C1ZUT0_EUMVA|nr:hypothetical protein EVAR_60662_1 [Eumeta japonica]
MWMGSHINASSDYSAFVLVVGTHTVRMWMGSSNINGISVLQCPELGKLEACTRGHKNVSSVTTVPCISWLEHTCTHVDGQQYKWNVVQCPELGGSWKGMYKRGSNKCEQCNYSAH